MSEQTEKKRFKSQMIVFEGVDGTGKTYLINELMSMHKGLFKRISFPTEQGRAKLADFRKIMDPTNIEDIMKYNFMFIQDIIDFQPALNELLFRGRDTYHVLVDRYYFSSIAYLKHDINKYFEPNKQKAYTKWGALNDTVLHKWINTCRVPDHVLLLIDNFAEKDEASNKGLQSYTHDDLQSINKIYKEEIQSYWNYLNKKHRPLFVFEEVEALNNTDFFVENYLLGHKIIDAIAVKQ